MSEIEMLVMTALACLGMVMLVGGPAMVIYAVYKKKKKQALA
ncbi:hypothetical protein [Photobacterium makurazakiensis]